MSMSFAWAMRSDVGVVRTNNEDCAYARPDLLVLADGMGGHAGGEVASVVALHAYAEALPGEALMSTTHALADAARTTREALQAMSRADESLETMGTTAVAVAITADGCWVSHIGDSRAYLLREGELTQLTTDHTHVQQLVEMGRITPQEVHSHPYRAMLLRSLDDQGRGAPPDIFAVDLRAGDRLLLCSDGLSDYVDTELIAQTTSLADPDEAAATLVDSAIRHGTRDNITVIVADVVEDDSVDSSVGGSHASDTRARHRATEEFAGAATTPMQVSEAARRALRVAFPGFDHPVGASGAVPDDLTITQTLPVINPGATPTSPISASPTAANPVPAHAETTSPAVAPNGSVADPGGGHPVAERNRTVPIVAILTGGVVVAVSVAIGVLLAG